MTMNYRSLSVRTTNNDTERIGAEAIFRINFVRLLSLRAQSVLEETDKLQRSKDQVFCADKRLNGNRWRYEIYRYTTRQTVDRTLLPACSGIGLLRLRL